MEQIFIINDRFSVNPSLNLVEDLKTGEKTRLEPRLMKLLCLLCEYEGKLISRNFLIKEIWEGYGGADEGLSQAISSLRKIFADEKKKLIETIPKKGYLMHATISTDQEVIPRKTRFQKKKNLLLSIAFGITIALVAFFVFIPIPNNTTSANYKSEIKALKVKIKQDIKKRKKSSNKKIKDSLATQSTAPGEN